MDRQSDGWSGNINARRHEILSVAQLIRKVGSVDATDTKGAAQWVHSSNKAFQINCERLKLKASR
jgi:hypothetical protein